MADEPILDTQEARRRSIARLKSNGHAPQAQRSNAAAPAADTNWALLIGEMAAQQELSCRRQIEAVREELVALAAKPNVADDLSEKAVSSLTRGLAKSIAPFVKDCIKEAMATRDARLAALEDTVRALAESAAASKHIVAAPHGDADSKSSGRFVHAVGGIVTLSP